MYKLSHLTKVKPKVVRLAVIGGEAVGKTQFIETMTSHWITAFLLSLWGPPAEGSAAYNAQRTPGVKIKEIVLPGGSVVRVLDMGGQQEFIASHRPIVITGFGMYLLVLNLQHGKERMLKSGKYWIRFVIATRNPAMFQDCPLPPLFVLFSHADMMASEEAQHLADDVYRCLRGEFHDFFHWMDGNPYVGNCRIPSAHLKRLLAGLAKAHSEVVEVSE